MNPCRFTYAAQSEAMLVKALPRSFLAREVGRPEDRSAHFRQVSGYWTVFVPFKSNHFIELGVRLRNLL